MDETLASAQYDAPLRADCANLTQHAFRELSRCAELRRAGILAAIAAKPTLVRDSRISRLIIKAAATLRHSALATALAPAAGTKWPALLVHIRGPARDKAD